MRRAWLRAALLCFAAAGCDNSTAPPSEDAWGEPDLAPDLSADLATPRDLTIPDLAPPPDLTVLPDLLPPDDLAPPPDMAVPTLPAGALVLNEVHATNLNGFADEDGEPHDWIELYNALAVPVDLTGVGLSTSAGSPFQWTFPSGAAIPANSYLLVWASKKNRAVWGRPLHTPFTIDNGTDHIYLTAPGGQLLDVAAPARTKPDVSWCRMPNLTGPFQHCVAPTPSAANAGTAYPAMLTPPSVSVAGGFYATPQSVTLSTGEMGAVVRYTLDGSNPTANSPAYTAPIPIASRISAPNVYANIPTTISGFYTAADSEVYKATVLRAATFANGKLSSPVNTHTYFVDPDIAARYVNTPVISMAVDPPSYFSPTNPRGIYVPGPSPAGGFFNINANFWLPTEVQGSIELFKPDRTIGFRTEFGSQISGNYSRNFQEKSLDVIFRDAYGAKTVNYPLFADRPYSKFKRFRLRNGGNDWNHAFIRDALINALVEDSPIGWGAWSPSVLFLDGEYWGYIELREKTTADYLESAYGVNSDAVDIIDIEVSGTPVTGDLVADDVIVKAGTRAAYDALTMFVASHPMSVAGNYELLKSMMDVDSFAAWYSAQVFIGNNDWPHNNTRMWREQKQDARWRWVFFDTDFGFGIGGDANANLFATIGNGSRIGNLAAQLLQNKDFKNLFIQAQCDQLNAWFSQPVMQAKLVEMSDKMAALVPELLNRYNLRNKSIDSWRTGVSHVSDYMALREAVIIAQAQTQFALGTAERTALTVNVNDLSMGNVKVNTIDLHGRLTDVTRGWTGLYFPNVPIAVTALPKPGYKFVQWQGAVTSTQPTAQVTLSTNARLKAVFTADPMGAPKPPPPAPSPPAGLRNVALGAVATQSSTQAPSFASLAVDGNLDSTLANGSVTSTNSEANAWWQVDLGQPMDVYSLQLFSRTDCCLDRLSEFHVFVASTDMTGRTYASLVGDASIWKSYMPGPVAGSWGAPVGARGRYVRVQLAGTNVLNLAEVQVFAVPVQTAIPDPSLLRNLALGRPASQSSVAFNGDPARAVDGNPSGDFNAGSVTHTGGEVAPWWEVDLGANHQLASLLLLNRTDCCGTRLADFNVFISTAPMTGKTLADLKADPTVWKSAVPAPVSQFVQIPSETIGRYVRVQLNGAGPLSLAEAIVLGLTSDL